MPDRGFRAAEIPWGPAVAGTIHRTSDSSRTSRGAPQAHESEDDFRRITPIGTETKRTRVWQPGPRRGIYIRVAEVRLAPKGNGAEDELRSDEGGLRRWIRDRNEGPKRTGRDDSMARRTLAPQEGQRDGSHGDVQTPLTRLRAERIGEPGPSPGDGRPVCVREWFSFPLSTVLRAGASEAIYLWLRLGGPCANGR